MSTLMGFIHSFPQHVPFLSVQIEGLWRRSSLIKHNRHLDTVDLRDSGRKFLTNLDTKIENTGRSKVYNWT